MIKEAEELHKRFQSARLARNSYDLHNIWEQAAENIHKHFEEAMNYYALDELDDAIKSFEIAISIAIAIEDHKTERELHLALGNVYASLRDFSHSEYHYKLAKNTIKKMEESNFERLTFQSRNPVIKLSRGFYIWMLVLVVVLSTTIVILAFTTRSPIIFLFLQIPLIIFYASTHYFVTGEIFNARNKPSANSV